MQTSSMLFFVIFGLLAVGVIFLTVQNYRLKQKIKDEKAGALLYQIVMFDFEFCTYLYRWYKEYKTTECAMESFHRAFFFSIERVVGKIDSWKKLVTLRNKINSEFDVNEETRAISQNAFISVGGRIKRLFEQEVARINELYIPHSEKNTMYQKMIKEQELFKGIYFTSPFELSKTTSLQ